MTSPITIAGCGPGHPDYLTTAVHNAVNSAEVLVGARHLLSLFPADNAVRLTVDTDIAAVLAEMENYRDRYMVVLVSGDSGLFSLARRVQQHFGHEHCRMIPGISSVQVTCARLGIDWHDLRIISAHGRTPEATIDELQAWRKIVILAGTSAANEWAADLLEQLGEKYRATVCENLTLPEEKIQTCDARTLRQKTLASRTIIVLLHQEVTA
ncbi:MAG: precorrin-6y C5,15-methyltransferase (decarboxylating) subunit CbiE [Desulfuromonadaceae bacterium]|nr:precorrin-6y C5,15-methyltransferase (decarboxylating) subunit CbiE [Desulfuromonadaceae bacterium]